MRVAACLSGEARLLEEPCTTRAIFDRVVVPLNSEVFIALNVASPNDIRPSEERIQSILMAYNPPPVVRLLEVKVFDNGMHTTKMCTKDDEVGRKQAIGLVRCATSIFAQPTPYDWIVRLRTDLYIPYRVHSLPDARRFDGRILVDYVGLQCMQGVAWWTDDRLAFLPLERAQKAYLLGYSDDFCKRPTGDPGWRPAECKLGWTLASRKITPIGLNGTWRRRIRIVHATNACTTLNGDNHHRTHPWPNVSEVLTFPYKS